MPKPIATAAVAFIEFTMVRHWFASLAAILAFTIFCFLCDNREMDEHKHPFTTLLMLPLVLLGGICLLLMEKLGGKKPIGNRPQTTLTRWVTATCRIYAMNVRLAWKIFWAVLLLLTVIGGAVAILAPKETLKADGGGPESEKFYRFANTATAPLQWITEGIRFGLGILAIIFLATLYFTYRVFAFSPVVPIATAAVIVLVYAGWLWRTTRRIVAEEFGYTATLSHSVTALIPAQLTTWLLFIVLFFATQTGWHWLIAQIPE